MQTRKTAEEIEAERENLRRLHLAIGQFIFEFSQLEFMIRHLLGEALELHDDARFHAVTSPYDFATLCRVTRTIAMAIPGCTDAEIAELDAIFKDCLKVNEDRVHVAHGTWTPRITQFSGADGPILVLRVVFSVRSVTAKPRVSAGRGPCMRVWRQAGAVCPLSQARRVKL
jgi:hypothetical protein